MLSKANPDRRLEYEPIMRPFTYCPNCKKYINPGFRTDMCPFCHADFSQTKEFKEKVESENWLAEIKKNPALFPGVIGIWREMNKKTELEQKETQVVKQEKPKVIYLAGPYRAKDQRLKAQNIMKARNAAERLWKQGWVVLCPHLNTAFFDEDCPEVPNQVWLMGGMELLSRCDAVYMLKEFRNSEGAMNELGLAQKLGIEILFEGTS